MKESPTPSCHPQMPNPVALALREPRPTLESCHGNREEETQSLGKEHGGAQKPFGPSTRYSVVLSFWNILLLLSCGYNPVSQAIVRRVGLHL